MKNVEKAVSRVNVLMAKGDFSGRISLEGKDEISYLTGQFDNLLNSLEGAQGKIIAAEKAQAKIQMARDVAHNIRSPILAIEMLIPTIHGLSGKTKEILKKSVAEIKELSEKEVAEQIWLNYEKVFVNH